MPDLTPARPSRKGKEREQTRDPIPTDLAEKFIAHQRRTAACVLSPICAYPTLTSHLSLSSLAFIARQNPRIGLNVPSHPHFPPHPFLPEDHTRYPLQVTPSLTTPKTQTRTSSLVDSRYLLLPTRVHGLIRNFTTQTPTQFQCAIIKNLTSRSNVVHLISLLLLPSCLVHNSIPPSARMRSSASCSIIARTIPSVSQIWQDPLAPLK